MEIPRAEITRIESGTLEGRRPRNVGCNACKQAHGDRVFDPIVRIDTDRGVNGFGWSRLSESVARSFLGRTIDSLFALPSGSRPEARALDFPLWDLVGKLMERPVYELLGGSSGSVPVYDSSIYIDDLDCSNDDYAINLILREIDAGLFNGHRSFKMKVGRGFMWMPHDEGIRRDIALIRAVRKRVDRDVNIMIDANNGYSLNDVKHVFEEVADCDIYWMEEPFPENAYLLRLLKDHFAEMRVETRISDGEGNAPSSFLELVESGLVDIVQYDMRSFGFSAWLELASRIDEWGGLCAPHCWGSLIDTFHQAHFARGISNFCYIECDTMRMVGLASDGYVIRDGYLNVSDAPGFGLGLDGAIFGRAVGSGGFSVS